MIDQFPNMEPKKEKPKWHGEITPYSKDMEEKAYEFFPKMWGQLGRPWDTKTLQVDMADIPNTYQKNGGEFWLATKEQEIVGCTGIKALENNIAELRRFYVLNEHRGQNIGVELLHNAIVHAIKEKFKELVLDTDVEKSKKAIGLFKAAGFREVPAYKETPYSNFFMGLDLENYQCPFCGQKHS